MATRLEAAQQHVRELARRLEAVPLERPRCRLCSIVLQTRREAAEGVCIWCEEWLSDQTAVAAGR